MVLHFYAFLLNIKSVEMKKDWIAEKFDDTFNSIFSYHIRGIANNEGIKYLEQFLKNLK